MRTLLLAGAALLALSFPAFAQSCQFTMDQALSQISDIPHVTIDDADAVSVIKDMIETTVVDKTVKLPDGITRFLIAFANSTYEFGFEVGGCLSQPFLLDGDIGRSLLPVVIDSGKTAAGTGA